MGLTIHYKLSKHDDAKVVEQTVHQMRQLALALPFEEVGEWNTMVAGFAGALSDALAGTGINLDAPIKDFQEFERLEFKGRKKKHLAPFLKAMKALAKV